MPVTLSDILAARQVIGCHAWHTPLLHSESLSRRVGSPVYLKPECWQVTGSFKLRGALNKLASLSPGDLARGAVTASAGNHGLGIAYAARALLADRDVPPVTIFVPETAAANKVQRLAALGCDLHVAGADYDATHALAEAHALERGALYLSAYDDPAIIAGQGTAGFEILEDVPGVGLLLVPVGGGGLIAGIAVAARAIQPGVRIVGLQPEASPSAHLSLRDGRPYETYPAGPTICDGLAGGFGRLPFEIARNLVDEIVVVPEVDVRRAVAWLAGHEGLIVEGSGAIAVAPLLSGQLQVQDRRVVAILTGRNLDASLLRQIMAEKDTL
ncbi:MAG: threonine/serine dehydratase [Anaerolineae bacterium]|nr:threonine/serine dehydratase [Anaerolineae bacterium]